MAEARNVLIELHMHDAIFRERMHLARFGFTRLEESQGFRDRHLEDEDLPFAERRLRDAVARLDHRGVARVLGRRDPRRPHEEFADAHRVGGVVRTLINSP
jgi:hypothetical protein